MLELEAAGAGPIDVPLMVRLRRAGRSLDVTVHRVKDAPEIPPAHPAIDRLTDGVYYVDLDRASQADIDAVLPQLVAAPGIVFDLRQYPNSNDHVLSYLLPKDDVATWERMPRMTRPNSASHPVSWKPSSDTIPMRAPRLRGRIAFVIGPRAGSWAESVLSIVASYHLGELVGAATAGINGSFVQILLPTGCNARFTGELVTQPDGTQLYQRGVQPTIPAAPTIAGIAAGRDEVLERALDYVRTGHK